MPKSSRPCKESIYGYDPADVIRIGDKGSPGKAGPPGPPGKKGDPGAPGLPGTDGGTVIVTAGTTIHGRRVVRMEAGLAYHPDVMNNSHAFEILGISLKAATTGNSFPVRTSGTMIESSWSWFPGFVFCGVDGVLTQNPQALGWLQRVARVINPTTINVDIDTPFIRNS